MRLGDVSRLLNRISGGKPGQSLCGRIAGRWGTQCLFCRAVAWVLRDPRHCFDEFIKDVRSGNA